MIKAGLIHPPCCCCSLASQKDAFDFSHPLGAVAGGLVVPLGGANPVACGVEQGTVEVSLPKQGERAHVGCPSLAQTSGKWYYEVVLSAGVEQPRVGWVGQGVPVGFGGAWPAGATIGCSIDFDAHRMEYTVNGARWG